jgi:hypothetical protein
MQIGQPSSPCHTQHCANVQASMHRRAGQNPRRHRAAPALACLMRSGPLSRSVTRDAPPAAARPARCADVRPPGGGQRAGRGEVATSVRRGRQQERPRVLTHETCKLKLSGKRPCVS